MGVRNSTALMWAQASAVLDQAERMHRQFFHLASPAVGQAVWEPPVDVFEDEREVLVTVALPGVQEDRVEVTLGPGFLLIRAERRMPFAGAGGALHRLEIPYGRFERRIGLPVCRIEGAARELIDGCLVVRLFKVENT